MTEFGTVMVTRLEMTIADNRDSTKCTTISRPIRAERVQTVQTGRWSCETGQTQIRDRSSSPISNLGLKVSLKSNPSNFSLQLLLESCFARTILQAQA